ncbi:MAG: ketopantoate reductase family protein [Pseudomonadota bacterium]
MSIKIAVYGAGAIGSHLAWRLARGGAQVGVVARGARLQAIRTHGLHVATTTESTALAVAAEEDPARLGPQDLVFITVKDRDLASVAPGLAPLLHAGTAIVSVQNGIPWWYFGRRAGRSTRQLPARHPAAAQLDAVIGERPLFGAVVSSPSTVTGTGIVQLDGANHAVWLGATRADGDGTAAGTLAALFTAGGIRAAVPPDIREPVWDKLVRNACTGLIALLTNHAPAEVMDDPVLHRLSCTLAHEVAAIAGAYGYHPDPDAPSLAVARALHHVPSLVQDFRSGRVPELDCQCFAPLGMARLAGVAVPQLELLAALARKLVQAP